jgi:hypothetical protein
VDTFAITLARLAARAKRAGVDRESLDTLTVGEVLRLIKEADRERRQWDRLADARSASLMALIANCHRKKNARAFKPADFMAPVEDDEEDETQFTQEQIEHQFISLAQTIGIGERQKLN